MMDEREMALVDCDGHIVESLTELRDYMDPKIRPFAENNRPFASSLGVFPSLDGIHHVTVRAENNPVSRRPAEPGAPPIGSGEDWAKVLDAIGLRHSVLYTSDGLAIGSLRLREYLVPLCRAYNDYVADRFRRVDSRLHPMALIPMQFPDDAAAELRRSVLELGLPGAMLPSTGLPLHLGHEFFWPIYKMASDLNCVLGVHGGPNRGLGVDSFTSFIASHVVHHPVALMYAFLTLIYDGAMDKFPNARYAFLEGGVEWILLVLERVHRDESFFDAAPVRHYFESGRVLVGCEGNDRVIPYLVKQVGPQFLAFSSDYPHEAGVGAVKHEIEETLEENELSDSDKQAILGGNATRFFGFANA
jgi:predicted TIM-barrel fold metal-dependent hydrolase